jgi:Negative regulator of beta-lactamase expression
MLQIPNNNFNPGNFPKTHIIIHGTAGGTSALEIANYFKGTEGSSNPTSSHYIVDQAGQKIQCVQEHNGAWANGSPEWNNKGISIEHVKSATDNSSILTPAQQTASFELIKDICNRHGIPRKNILPHNAVYNTACPGPFPWDSLTTYLKGEKPMATEPTPNQITAYAKRWNAIRQDCVVSSGIGKAWVLDYINGIYHGPPMSLEYPSIDWNGNAIIVQEFMYGWCEWRNGAPTWYKGA